MADIIIKNSNNMELFYYNKDSGKIFKKEYKNNIWGREEAAAENARESFSPAFGGSDILIYQQLSGDICLAEKNKPHQILLKHKGNKAPDIIINYIEGGCPKLIYNIVETDGSDRLIYQFGISKRDGSSWDWSKPQAIDSFDPLLAEIVSLGSDKYILIYSKKMPEMQIGYREILRHNIGIFKLIYATGHNIKDISYVITNDVIHFAFLLTLGFSNRIVYVRRDSGGLSRPVTIFEGFNIKKCLVGIIKNKLYIWWISNNFLNYCFSYDLGISFNKIQTDRSINALNIKKAVFRDNTPADENEYVFNQVFIDGENILGIKQPFYTDIN